MITFNNHKKLKRTSRNIIITSIGFLFSIIAGIFVLKTYVREINKKTQNNSSILYISIENQSNQKKIPYYLIIKKDTLLKKTIIPGKQTFEIAWNWDNAQTITQFFGDSIKTQNIDVSDSISYLMIEIHSPLKNPKTIQVESLFFE